MKDSEKRKIVQGIECCLGIDGRKCEGCPFKRYHGREDGKCLERVLRQALVAVQETMTEVTA